MTMELFGKEILQFTVHFGVEALFTYLEHVVTRCDDQMLTPSNFFRLTTISMFNLTIFGHYNVGSLWLMKLLFALGSTIFVLFNFWQENEPTVSIWRNFKGQVSGHYRSTRILYILGQALLSAALATFFFNEPFMAAFFVGILLSVASYLWERGGQTYLPKATIACLNLMMFVCFSLFKIGFAPEAVTYLSTETTGLPTPFAANRTD